MNMRLSDAYLYKEHQQTGWAQALVLEPIQSGLIPDLYDGLTIHLDQGSPGTLTHVQREHGLPGQSQPGDENVLEQRSSGLLRYYGARLMKGHEGLTGLKFTNTLEPLAGGGADVTHRRPTEGVVVLPVLIRQPTKDRLDAMVATIVDICTRYPSQQVRTLNSEGRELTKKLVYREGLETASEVYPGSVTLMLSFDAPDPFWYAPRHYVTRRLQMPAKKFITAHAGSVDHTVSGTTVHRWLGREGDSTSEKYDNGVYVGRNYVQTPSFEYGPAVLSSSVSGIISNPQVLNAPSGDRVLQVYFDANAWVYSHVVAEIGELPPGDQWLAFSGYVRNLSGSNHMLAQVRYNLDGVLNYGTYVEVDGTSAWQRYEHTIWIPEGATNLEFMIYMAEDGTTSIPSPGTTFQFDALHADVGATEQEALDQIQDYFDGSYSSTIIQEDGYEVPFFPIFLGGATVQEQIEVNNQSDYPIWPKFEISGTGLDPLIRLEVPGVAEEDMPQIRVEVDTEQGVILDSQPGVQLIINAQGESLFPHTTRMDWFSIPPRTKAQVSVFVAGAERNTQVRLSWAEKTPSSGIY